MLLYFVFVASLPLCAYAISVNDLNALTLCALTIFPRKARREPTCVLEAEASTIAFAHDTPPYEYA